MFRHILVALDGSESSNRALAAALRLAVEAKGEVWALSVEEHLPRYAASVGEVEEAKHEMDAYFRKVQDEAQRQAALLGMRLRTVTQAGHAAATIVRFARERGFDLVVLGGSARGLGGTADKVVEQAPCSVLIVREAPLSMNVEDIMARDVAAVQPDTPLGDVVELLIRRGIKAVPVVDAEGSVVGMITGGDLLERGGLRHRLSLVKTLDTEIVAGQLRDLTSGGQTAHDVMTPDPLTLRARTRVSAAARIMAERRFKRLPVVDEDGKLVGILARLDVLRSVAHMAQEPPTQLAGPQESGRLVREFMTTSLPTVAPDSPAADVLQRLAASPYRRVVVVDAQRKVLGIITDHELIQHVGPEPRAGLLKVLAGRTAPLQEMRLTGRAEDMMIRNTVTVTDDAPIMEALELMIANRVKRLPVIDDAQRLVGMVDRDAVLRAIAGQL